MYELLKSVNSPAELRALGAAREAAHRGARAGGPADLVLEGRRAGWHEAVSEDYLAVRVAAGAPWAAGLRRVRAMLRADGGALVAEAA